MSIGANGERLYHLSFSGRIAATIRRLQRQASQEGRGKEFLAAVREVIDRLQRDPTVFGEPLYWLSNLHLQVRCATVRPLYVDFAVHETRPLVILKAVKLLSATSS